MVTMCSQQPCPGSASSASIWQAIARSDAMPLVEAPGATARHESLLNDSRPQSVAKFAQTYEGGADENTLVP